MPLEKSAAALAQQLRLSTTKTQAAALESEDAHGSSGWLQAEEAQAAGLFRQDAPLLFGRADNGHLLRYGGTGHCLTFAPTGAGKGVSVVVPNLLAYPGSVVCLDPKGAIAAVTAKQRLAMGQEVVLLDPFGEVENAINASGRPDRWHHITPASYNPLGTLAPGSKTLVDDARLLAASLVMEEEGKNRYFSDSARMVLEAVMLYVLAVGGQKALTFESIFEVAFDDKANWLPSMLKKDDFGGHISHMARQIETLTGDGGNSVWSTLFRSLNLIKSPVLLPALRPSTLDFRRLKMERPTDRGTSVYLVLPAKHLHTHGVWLRLMLTAILNQVSDARPSRFPVLFMVDECAALGRLELLETAVGLMRGYGLKLWLIFQDLPQLQSIYGKRAASFLSNSGVKQFFNVNDLETADFVSNYLGNETRRVFSESVNFDQILGGGNIGLIQRALLTSDEVRRMEAQEQVLFYEGLKPFRAKKISYWRDADFKQLASPDPYIAA